MVVPSHVSLGMAKASPSTAACTCAPYEYRVGRPGPNVVHADTGNLAQGHVRSGV